MRGGAIPLLAWGALLVVLGALNWIWTGSAIQVGSFGFAILVVIVGAGALVLLCRASLRPGPPEPRAAPEVVPDISVGAVLAGLGVGSLLFGFVFGTFFVYFGAAVFLVSLGRIAVEVRAQRRTEHLVEDEVAL